MCIRDSRSAVAKTEASIGAIYPELQSMAHETVRSGPVLVHLWKQSMDNSQQFQKDTRRRLRATVKIDE
eukprot:10092241-Alexandrium_andersonii.AAC.1